MDLYRANEIVQDRAGQVWPWSYHIMSNQTSECVKVVITTQYGHTTSKLLATALQCLQTFFSHAGDAVHAAMWLRSSSLRD